MQIQQERTASDELLAAMRRLVPQLNPAAQPPTRERLEALVGSGSCALLAARDASGIVGMLTLAWYPTPTALRVWIEDVVVDAGARGRGIGEALVRAGLERARELGAASVELTSRPEREAANRLYQRLGFQSRRTNAYRFVLPP